MNTQNVAKLTLPRDNVFNECQVTLEPLCTKNKSTNYIINFYHPETGILNLLVPWSWQQPFNQGVTV